MDAINIQIDTGNSHKGVDCVSCTWSGFVP
jgi:hypothetical protein